MQVPPRIITIVGPESSGKTTLARHLADTHGCPWVPEYARAYLERLGAAYTEADLPAIAAGQREALVTVVDAWVRPPQGKVPPYIFVDSGILSVVLWARLKYGRVAPEIEHLLADDPTDVYLLRRPLPQWEADPMREAPLLLDRAWIYNHYLLALGALGKPFHIYPHAAIHDV